MTFLIDKTRESVNANLKTMVGCFRYLKVLKSMDVHMCIVEGDSQTIISWSLGRGDMSWRVAPIVYEIWEVASLMECSLVHIDRGQNALADRLANWGILHGMAFNDNCLPRDLESESMC